MVYKTVTYRDAANNECKVIYHLFGDQCVFLSFSNTTVVFAEDIIKAIQEKELRLPSRVRFYDLIPLGKRNPKNYGHDAFEFCEVVEDLERVGGCPLDWLHTRCPTEVLQFFRKFLPPKPRQTFDVVSSGKCKIYEW